MAKGKYQRWIEPEGLALIEGWARNGLTDEQIAKKMGVSRSTLNEWKEKYPDISDTLKKGKEVVDSMVENALLKRALGYTSEETTSELRYDKKTGKKDLVITKRVRKEVPPDTTAAIFWLKNRKPDVFRDRQEVEVAGLAEEQSKLAELLEQRRKNRK